MRFTFLSAHVLLENVLRSEQLVSIHTQLEQNRHIIHDFAVTTLSAIPNDFGRLTYIASLRDLSTGRYEHAGLASLYPEDAIQQALKQCHDESRPLDRGMRGPHVHNVP